MRKLSKGFTLLELLVVIAIIGILISMGVAAFSTAQRKGRDSKRRGDMKAIQSGFEQYYAENGGYDECATMAAVAYLPSGLPNDPKNQAPYTYSCDGDAATDTYCTCATLEDEGTGNANAPTGASCNFAAGGDYYCMGNLQ